MRKIKLFEEFFNEAIITPSLSKEVTEGFKKITADYQARLDATKDLWEVDKIGSDIEIGKGYLESSGGGRPEIKSSVGAPNFTRDDLGKAYNNFHRNLVPAWISKHWGKDMLYKGDNLMDLLYKEVEPKFHKFLEGKGLDCQECYVGYAVGSTEEQMGDDDKPRNRDYDEGTFKMGFDIWEKKENDEKGKSGWGCFVFNMESFFQTDIKTYKEDKINNLYGGRDESVKFIITLGEGMFYNYKLGSKGPFPVDNLADYFSDGGYTLRLD